VDLDLWLGDQLVAHTVTRDRGRKVRIIYDVGVASGAGNEVPVLSCSLPTPGPSGLADSRAFLEGLLPEGRALEAAAAQVRGVRLHDGAPENPGDAIALLAEFGRECAGAVVVVPAGDGPPHAGSYQPLTDDDLIAVVRNLPRHPLGTDLDREIRMSLAGAQPKFLLARLGGAWQEPIDGAPSTHILKPTIDWPHSAQNEALVLALARTLGLTECAAWVEQVGATSVLVTERYDRTVDGDVITRLHQEDMCQAIGMRPKDKYDIGRPSGQMARLLRRFTDDPATQTRQLFEQVAFRIVVGDEDGHGKNYSLLLADGTVRLAPIYDTLCTQIYPELTGQMATKIGAQENLAKVDRAALVDEARAMGVPAADASDTLDALSAGLRDAIEGLDDALTEGWPSDHVIGNIRARTKRLDGGTPLGHPPAASTRRKRS
jgi:serine/threonine-protein kinase HipA